MKRDLERKGRAGFILSTSNKGNHSTCKMVSRWIWQRRLWHFKQSGPQNLSFQKILDLTVWLRIARISSPTSSPCWELCFYDENWWRFLWWYPNHLMWHPNLSCDTITNWKCPKKIINFVFPLLVGVTLDAFLQLLNWA